ncbi:restriction endonuclease subunit S [Phascolarctobacterium sp. Marseille-Q4147]|uniref:restriction endonuclease subunit S n=1 Tax=Phascolarctobacterium sp. Marseille-Q4147 TaxID=2823317 RepID=UPI001B31CF34|nr:restriction endonuclease subunit S [Phascolarctobacterium sp. Marseille-Q4147]QTV77174.1 restriction endonuclease subunit S [Phascolarctobacterium sp. Marseille-Q4147]
MPKKKTALTIEERLQQALVPAEEQPYEVPENWVWVRLGSLADVKGGKRLPKGTTFSENITKHPYIRVTDFNAIGVSLEGLKYIDEDVYEKISRYTISSDDIYVSIAGSIGKVGIIPSCIDGANLTENAAKITNIKGINQKYLCLFLKSEFAQYQMQSATIATTQAKLALFRIESLTFPLPPLSEQQHIVERIEELFAKLDEAKERLQEVADSFAVRKAAILHKAFTGELTKQWRWENGVSDESWEEKTIGDVCTVNPKKIDAKNLDDNLEVSFVPMAAVSDVFGEIVNHEVKNLQDVRTGFTNFSEGDVIFAKITPCMENGKSAIVGPLVNDIGYGSTEFYVLRCKEELYNKYLYHMVRNTTFRAEAKAVMTGAVGQQRVPKTFLQEYQLLLPSIPEQHEIVRLIDDLLARERAAQQATEQALASIDLMKKSILARAFRGELGTNKASEASALELLRQVLAEN